MNATAKPSAPTAAQTEEPLLPAAPAVVRLKHNSLTHDPAFTPRIGIAKNHVHDLARALRIHGDLDPVKVWSEPGTGKQIILDGRHRVAAYRFSHIDSIPAVVFQGSRKDARLEAAKDNAKTTFPWTTSECTQFAWGLVIEGEASKLQIVRATTVSTGTVSIMRRRLKEMTAAKATPSGNWWRDRNDKRPVGQPEDDSDEAKQAHIKMLLEEQKATERRFKAAFGQRPTPEVLGLSWRAHLGLPRYMSAVSGGCQFDEDEFSGNPEQQPLPQQNTEDREAF